MARADPTRSNYCATRHLLRNLRRTPQLRRNPLARDAYEDRSGDDAARAVARRVERALRAMSARHAAILLRIDVQRHDPRLVAADLGLSTRQFHRERRAAHDRFIDVYREAPPTRTSVTSDLPQCVLQRAASLGDSGEASSAGAMLDDIARSGVDAPTRCMALTRLAEVEAWSHRLDRARVHLNAARVLIASSPDNERQADVSDAAAAAELTLQWFACGPSAIGHAPVRGRRETLVRAAAALRSGESAYASRLLRRIDGPASVANDPSVCVDLLALQAELADFTAADPLLSEELFARAAALARANGLNGRALYATHQLALTRWAHSRAPSDRSAYRRLVDRIDCALPPRLRSYLTFSAADVELAIGHPGRALAAAEAAARVSTNRYENFSARGLAAGALLRLGRIADAGTHARVAAHAARSEGHARVVSLAQRISAQAYLAVGDRRAARNAIEESIECARNFSSPHVLAQAQAVLGRIAGR